MKKHIIILIAVYFSLITYDLEALRVPNSPKAKEAFQLLEKLPDYHHLLQDVEREGSIEIEMLALKNESFDAFWDSTTRVIRINTIKNEDINVLICSILFEMHNAKSDKRFNYLYTRAMTGQISKEDYVENVERMEHMNALNCATLIEKGIRLGIFNEKARWPILRHFDDHYVLQQIEGHSDWLAKNYENMSPYKNSSYIGTIPKFSVKEKQDIIRYLSIKNDIESKVEMERERGLKSMSREYERCVSGGGSMRGFNFVFKKVPEYQRLKG